MFIPMDEVPSRGEQKDFRNDPNIFLGFGDEIGVLNALMFASTAHSSRR
jgi:hypothetical protein